MTGIRWVIVVTDRHDYVQIRCSDAGETPGEALGQLVRDEPDGNYAGATARVFAYSKPDAMFAMERHETIIKEIG